MVGCAWIPRGRRAGTAGGGLCHRERWPRWGGGVGEELVEGVVHCNGGCVGAGVH